MSCIRRVVNVRLAVVAVLLVPASMYAAPRAAAAAKQNVAGSWKIEGNVQGVAFTDLCELTQKDDAITGTCHLEDGKPRDVKGTAGEKTITLSHAGEYQGEPLTLTFNGALAEDGTLSGSVDVDPQNVSGDWKGRRSEDAAPPPPAENAPKPQSTSAR